MIEQLRQEIEKRRREIAALEQTLEILAGGSPAVVKEPVPATAAVVTPGKGDAARQTSTAAGTQRERILKALYAGPKTTAELCETTGIETASLYPAMNKLGHLIEKVTPGTRGTAYKLTTSGIETAKSL